MHEKIQDFILSQKVLSLGILDDDQGVYCASCYYAFDVKNLALIFASHSHTKHIQLACKYPHVAANIAYDNNTLKFIKGLQIKAIFKEATKEQEKIYFKKFAFAKFSDANLYVLEIQWAKYTDNQILLNKKLEFKRCL